jgi:hypothetical protein
LGCNYFEVARGLLHPGELIDVSTTPRPSSGGSEPQLALVMVWRKRAARSRSASCRTSAAGASRREHSTQPHHQGGAL